MKVIQTPFGSGVLTFGRYANGRTAIQISDPEDGSPIATVTVNLPDKNLAPEEIFVKGWSENSFVPSALARVPGFKDTGRRVPTGFVEAQVWTFKDAS